MKVLYLEYTKFGRKNLDRRKIFWKFELKLKTFFCNDLFALFVKDLQ